MFLLDRYGRPLKKLRISITDRCNYNCIFCHKEGIRDENLYEAPPRSIASLIRFFADLGVSEVKITGGEPLLREDLEDIILRISQIEDIQQISMTTNASMLEKRAEELKKAGLARLNANFLTTDSNIYKALTGGELQPVLRGLKAAKEVGIWPIKLNMLILRGFNDSHFERVLKFAKDQCFLLQVIELMPEGEASQRDFFNRHHVDLSDIKSYLDSKALKNEQREFQRRIVYHFHNNFKVEVVDPIANREFCRNCTRIRITPNLMLKPCLMRKDNLVTIDNSLNNLGQAILLANRKRAPYFDEYGVEMRELYAYSTL